MDLPMDTPKNNNQALRYVAGPLFLACCAAGYNLVAFKKGRPTISEGVRWVANRGGGAELAGAIIGGLLAHWLLNNGQEKIL
jgi:hypothetical protein